MVDNYRNLFWGQGQFLTPQHLQQQNLYLETKLRALTQTSQNHFWGIKTLQIRDEALNSQTIDITECEWLTQSGILIKCGSNMKEANAILHPRAFDKDYDTTKGPLSVYLTLSQHQIGQNNLNIDDKPVKPGVIAKRYVLAAKEEADLFDHAAPQAALIYTEYFVQIFFGHEELFNASMPILETIKIAEIIPAPEQNQFKRSHQFIPSCLVITASHVLTELTKNVRDLLIGRAQEFAHLTRSRGLRASSTGPQEILRTLMLQTLNRHIATFHHFVEIGAKHPEETYLLFRKLIAELSVFSEDYNVFGATNVKSDKGSDDGLKPYNHQDLWGCFHHAWLRIRDLIMALTSGPEQIITLEYDGKAYYKSALPASLFEQPLSRYYLMIDSIVPGTEITTRLQNTGKISTLEEMEQIRRSAVFGLKIEFLPTPPEELPQRSSRYTYFRIDTQSKTWSTIINNRNIAVFCDLDPNDTVIKIVRVGSS